MHPLPRPFWHPMIAGFALGLVLLITFLITGHGLGASGFFARLTVAASDWLLPEWASGNTYIARYLGGGNPLVSWISWEIVGVVIGAAAGSLTSGRFRAMIERENGVSVVPRLGYAFLGGALVGFGARLARGCTSGLGLSGGGTLALAGFVFLLGFFVAGLAVSQVLRRMRQ